MFTAFFRHSGGGVSCRVGHGNGWGQFWRNPIKFTTSGVLAFSSLAFTAMVALGPRSAQHSGPLRYVTSQRVQQKPAGPFHVDDPSLFSGRPRPRSSSTAKPSAGTWWCWWLFESKPLAWLRAGSGPEHAGHQISHHRGVRLTTSLRYFAHPHQLRGGYRRAHLP
jgi:hypothetical protein